MRRQSADNRRNLNASPAWREDNGFGRTAGAFVPSAGEARSAQPVVARRAYRVREAISIKLLGETYFSSARQTGTRVGAAQVVRIRN